MQLSIYLHVHVHMYTHSMYLRIHIHGQPKQKSPEKHSGFLNQVPVAALPEAGQQLAACDVRVLCLGEFQTWELPRGLQYTPTTWNMALVRCMRVFSKAVRLQEGSCQGAKTVYLRVVGWSWQKPWLVGSLCSCGLSLFSTAVPESGTLV